MSISPPRSRLIAGRDPINTPLRPPWAAADVLFTERCDRCGKCSFACPPRIIIKGSGGYPEVDFNRGECTFCGECSRSCPTQALEQTDAAPWHLQANIAQPCISLNGVVCYRCQEACPENAIQLKPQTGGYFIPQIQSQHCTGCGACVVPCPVNAIKLSPIKESV